MADSESPLTSVTNLFRPATRPIDRLIRPIQTFAKHKLAGAGLLMLATVVALVWANSPWHHAYHHLLETDIAVSLGDASLSKTLHHWINDGLMGIFFFQVGLEIKRELLTGELSSVRKASLPAIAALGGMVVPAGIYLALNLGGPAQGGWGVPMATDIAFALGVLALLGDRISIGLKVFLTALAIVDDIGAVLVIALFYTSDLTVISLLIGLTCLLLSVGLNLAGSRNPIAYFVVGTCAWLAFLDSGIHATIAALLMAFTIPARTRIDGESFLARMEFLLNRLRTIGLPQTTSMNSNAQQHTFEKMNQAIDEASAPLQRIEHAIVGPVTFLVLPIFALANAGVTLHGDMGAVLTSPLVLGIVGGLLIGKTVGIAVSAWIAVKIGVADLPRKVTWMQVVGVGLLGGIGFTMALFVAGLAFDSPEQGEAAKVGILAGSTLAAVIGLLVLRTATKPGEEPKPAEADAH